MPNSSIDSKDNKKIKLIRKLRLKKNRYKENKFVIESRKLMEEALGEGAPIEFILLREDIQKTYEGYQVFHTSREIFDGISELTSPDGYMAVVSFPKIEIVESDRVLLLDRLSDPGNLGTIIRSSEAFGFNKIYLLDTVDPYNDKTLRASMGSIFRVCLEFIGLEELTDIKKNYQIYVAHMNGEDYRQEIYAGKVCLVIGNEANGISQDLFRLADKSVKIPMKGRLESLNAAISASLIMSQIDYIKNK